MQTRKTVGQRGPARVAILTYPQIAKWVGLRLSTVYSYAQRGIMPTDSVETLLEWVNTRRAAKGLPMVGVPVELDTLENETADVSTNTVRGYDSGYNPRKGDYET